MTEQEWERSEMDYWAAEQHPGHLPIHEREAWHRDAWDREQVALYEATHNSERRPYAPSPVDFPEVWQI
jgi:hypothetical protein